MSDYNKERSPKAFNDRVDRHSNSFGNRVATKQTRVPPPVKAMTDMADTTQNWRSRTHTQEGENQGYVSPPYTNRRDDNPLNALFLADHTVVLNPQGGEDKEEDTGGDTYYNEASPLQPTASLSTRKTRPQRLKSIIISPSLEGEEKSRAPDQQENRTALEKEETLQEFQNKRREEHRRGDIWSFFPKKESK
ncbi:hypothetical protein F2Q69_00033787 [Brassica cretica]|uniref:Uncharacterized protein n=1 Tax=Brassica cretica TaxID=69181 RepID=A0A8S9SM06_BRACR|nr:hypothetical protein F2Q69_00033787 [Brassica cretica]